jgi:hypothetical protein
MSFVTNLLSQAIVDIHQQCLSQGINQAQITMTTNCANISNVTMESNISSNKAGCFSEEYVDMNNTQKDVARIFNEVFPKTTQQNLIRNRANILANVTQVLTAKVINTCLLMAKNDAIIDLGEVEGCVMIDNVNIKQKATTVVNACIQSTRVMIGDKDSGSLYSYLERNKENFVVPPPAPPPPPAPCKPFVPALVDKDYWYTIIIVMSSLVSLAFLYMLIVLYMANRS